MRGPFFALTSIGLCPTMFEENGQTNEESTKGTADGGLLPTSGPIKFLLGKIPHLKTKRIFVLLL